MGKRLYYSILRRVINQGMKHQRIERERERKKKEQKMLHRPNPFQHPARGGNVNWCFPPGKSCSVWHSAALSLSVVAVIYTYTADGLAGKLLAASELIWKSRLQQGQDIMAEGNNCIKFLKNAVYWFIYDWVVLPMLDNSVEL